jgi:arylsulfatase A-like enzyme
MMTGLFPARHGVVASDTRLARRTETLAESMARAGYETYAVVNTPWLQRDVFGFMRGFDRTRFVKGGGDRVAPNTLVADQARSWLVRE